jgi:hypothetical protein
MDTRFKRLELAVGVHVAEKWTPWARGKVQEHRFLARINTVIMRTDMQALVSQVNNSVYTVDLETKECSCTVFQENGIPCGHAIITIFARPGRDLVPFCCELENWMALSLLRHARSRLTLISHRRTYFGPLRYM